MPAENRLRILIIDDDQELRCSLAKIFQKTGFAVSTVSSADLAVLQLQKEPYPIVLLDLKMPGKSGLELLRRIKAESPVSKVIVIAASSDEANTGETMAAGAFEYLRKPLKRQEIFASAHRALEATKEV